MDRKLTVKRWSSEDTEYVRQNLGKKSLEEMAAYLERSPMAVRLHILHKRLTTPPKVRRNLLQKLIQQKFRHPEDFTPSRAFYEETGIGQRRWWALYFGRKAITPKEYLAVANYLGLIVDEAFEARQLDLFKD